MKPPDEMFIKADYSSPVGPMRPVHGVNNGPRTDDFMMDATDLFREIGIPYSRLHDVGGAFGHGVGILVDVERQVDGSAELRHVCLLGHWLVDNGGAHARAGTGTRAGPRVLPRQSSGWLGTGPRGAVQCVKA